MGMSEEVREFVGNALNEIYYENVLGAGFEVTYVGFLEEDEDDEDDAYNITFKLKDKPESMTITIVLYLDKDWREDKIVVYDNCGEECYFEYNANDPISLYLLFSVIETARQHGNNDIVLKFIDSLNPGCMKC